MVEAEAATLVDILDPGSRLAQYEHRLVDHRQQDAIDDEAGLVLAQHHFLAQALGKGGGAVGGRLRGRKPGDDLDQLHHRHRIEEMQPDEARRIGRVIRHPRDRDRAGVRRHDRIGGEVLASLFEDRLLDSFLLGRRLDDQARVLHRRVIGNRRDALQRRFGIGDLDLALADQLAQRLVDPGVCLLGDLQADIGEQHIDAVRGHGLRYSRTHLARTDDGNRIVHRNFLRVCSNGAALAKAQGAG